MFRNQFLFRKINFSLTCRQLLLIDVSRIFFFPFDKGGFGMVFVIIIDRQFFFSATTLPTYLSRYHGQMDLTLSVILRGFYLSSPTFWSISFVFVSIVFTYSCNSISIYTTLTVRLTRLNQSFFFLFNIWSFFL